MHIFKYLLLMLFIFSCSKTLHNSTVKTTPSFQEILIQKTAEKFQILKNSKFLETNTLSSKDLSFLIKIIKTNADSYKESIFVLLVDWKIKLDPLNPWLSTPTSSLLNSLNSYLPILETQDPLTFKVIKNLSLPDSGLRRFYIPHTISPLEKENRYLVNYISLMSLMEFYYTILTHPILQGSRYLALKKFIRKVFDQDIYQLRRVLYNEFEYLKSFEATENSDSLIAINFDSFFPETKLIVNALFEDIDLKLNHSTP